MELIEDERKRIAVETQSDAPTDATIGSISPSSESPFWKEDFDKLETFTKHAKLALQGKEEIQNKIEACLKQCMTSLLSILNEHSTEAPSFEPIERSKSYVQTIEESNNLEVPTEFPDL